jgi:predicted amidohydrolase
MQDICIAAVSMNGRLGEPEAVLNEVADWTAKAVAEGAELVVFPELVVHGHCTPNTYELAEAVPDGPSTQRLCGIAKEHKVVVCAGLSEKENDLVYNTQIVAGPDGYIGKQRKIHLSRDEVLFYKGGREMPAFDIGKCKIGIQICYDKLFPEITRVLCLRGAEVVLMPHAARRMMWDETPESQNAARAEIADYHAKIVPTRALENSCFVVLTDQVGRAGYVDSYPKVHPNQPHHPGGALISDPAGKIIAKTQDERIEPEMIVTTLEAAAINEERSQANFTLKTRRPELFGELAAEQATC